MSVELYRELSWFPKPPEDFSFLCKELSADSGDLGKRIRFLAIHALDERQLARLGRAIIQAQQNGRSLAPLVPFRLGLIGNGTLDLIVPVLIATAARLLGWGIKHRKRDRILPAVAFWASLLAILHSQLDFSLQIPGFAIVILALTGMGAASFSGTGPLALAAGLLLPRSLSRIPAFVAAAFGLLMVLLILYNLHISALDPWFGRLSEFTTPNTSAYARFVAPFEMVQRSFDSGVLATWLGNGSGSFTRDVAAARLGYEIADPDWAKVTYEYGLVGLFLMLAIVVTRLYSSALRIDVCNLLLFVWISTSLVLKPGHGLVIWLLTIIPSTDEGSATAHPSQH